MIQNSLNRREALKTAALGALALPLLGSAMFGADDAKAKKAKSGKAAKEASPTLYPPSSPDGRENGLRIGVASYSLRTIALDEAISTVLALRVKNIALFRAHCNWEEASVDECRAVGAKLKAAGMQSMVCKPDLAALPIVEKLAKEFDQKLAIHNHGPEDKLYPTPEVIWNAVKSLDSRIGLCIDVGHTARFGDDPTIAIKKYAARLYDVHMKDSVAVVGAQRDVPVEVGAGRLNIRAMLRTLLEINYNGVVAFEYEKVAGNPAIGLAESVGYVRGVLAAFAKT